MTILMLHKYVELYVHNIPAPLSTYQIIKEHRKRSSLSKKYILKNSLLYFLKCIFFLPLSFLVQLR